jgi:hypothetical protein
VMEAYERWLGRAEVAILHMIGLFDRPVEEDEISALRAEPAVSGLRTPIKTCMSPLDVALVASRAGLTLLCSPWRDLSSPTTCGA